MMTLLLSLALLTATADVATTENSGSPAVGQPAKPAKPKKICEKIEMSGSNVPKRVCRTVVEPVKPASEGVRADAAAPAGGGTN